MKQQKWVTLVERDEMWAWMILHGMVSDKKDFSFKKKVAVMILSAALPDNENNILSWNKHFSSCTLMVKVAVTGITLDAVFGVIIHYTAIYASISNGKYIWQAPLLLLPQAQGATKASLIITRPGNNIRKIWNESLSKSLGSFQPFCIVFYFSYWRTSFSRHAFFNKVLRAGHQWWHNRLHPCLCNLSRSPRATELPFQVRKHCFWVQSVK